MKKENVFALALSPLTLQVFAGRMRDKGTYVEAVGVRHDVTSTFYSVLRQPAQVHKGEFVVHANGVPAFSVKVTELDGQAEGDGNETGA